MNREGMVTGVVCATMAVTGLLNHAQAAQKHYPARASLHGAWFPEPRVQDTANNQRPVPPSYEGKIDRLANMVSNEGVAPGLPSSSSSASRSPGADMFISDGAESALAINATNGNNIIVAHNPGFLGLAPAHNSVDGNMSWTSWGFPNGGGTYTGSPFDPWTNEGNSPNEFFVTLIRRDTMSNNSHCVIARSVASGANYSLFFERTKNVFQDREMVDIDRTTARGGGTGSTHDGKVYLAYDDYGVNGVGYTGSFLQVVSGAGTPLTELTISTFSTFWGSQIQPLAGTNDGQVFLMAAAISNNGATRWLRFHEVTGGGSGLVLNKSFMTFPATGQRLGTSLRYGVNGHRINGHMFFDMDRSGGARNGWLYVISNRNPNPGNPALDQGDVYLSKSTDGANTWTSTLVPGPAAGKTQFFTMLDVDDNGWIHVAYYQNESGSVNGGVLNADAANVYSTLSQDGGNTWTSPVQINDAMNTLDYFDPPPDLSGQSYYLIGDYCQIKATGTGSLTKSYICWSGYDKDRSDIFLNDKRDRVLCTTVTMSTPTLNPPTVGDDLCVGGTNAGGSCATDADCPSGVCGLKSRYITITPPNAGAIAQSIQVTIASMPIDPARVGEVWWAGPSGSIPNAPNPALTGALVLCASTPSNAEVWPAGNLHLFGEPIVPGARFDVRMCDATGANCSTPLTVATGKWGDIVSPFGGGSQPNFADINADVAKFVASNLSVPDTPRSDLRGPGTPGTPNVPNQDTNFADINADVVAFQGIVFPFNIPACP